MKFKVGDRAKMTEMTGGYDFSNDPITGYVTVAKVTPNYYECFVEGYDDPEPLCFYESELLPIGEEEEKKEEKIPKYKVGDVVKMNDKHPYYFDGFEKMDGTMTVEEVHYTPYSIPQYLCSINGYTDEVDKEFLMYKGCLNFREEWIDGYAESFKPGDIVKMKGDHEDFTMSLDGLYGIVTKVADDDCEVGVYSPMAKQILYWQVWKRNMTKC